MLKIPSNFSKFRISTGINLFAICSKVFMQCIMVKSITVHLLQYLTAALE